MLGTRKTSVTLLLGLALLAPGAHAAGFETLYSFNGTSDGAYPYAGLIMDSAGNLYGTTSHESTSHERKGSSARHGSVFKLSPNGTLTTLYVFKGGSDGRDPQGSLISDEAGNLYGTTASGGANDVGTVFEVAPNGTETVLYSFERQNDGGQIPLAGLIADSAGNLYGTTKEGGDGRVCRPRSCGTVFKVVPNGYKTVLYSFLGQGRADGMWPEDTLLADSSGNFYGTTLVGGIGTNCHYGCGIVFKLAPDGTETVLHAFGGTPDGNSPYAGLIADSAGNLYGTTSGGGTNGGGTVFKLAPDGTETVLYSFTGAADGGLPMGGLIADTSGNFYGTTSEGGANGGGTVFKLAPDGTETVLHSFYVTDGADPRDGLIADSKGNLYGTTLEGGKKGRGTVFTLPE